MVVVHMNIDYQIALQECYLLSKTLAEIAAWKFAKENGIDMISLCLPAVIGPMLQPTTNLTTIFFVFNLINGMFNIITSYLISVFLTYKSSVEV